MAWLCLGVLGCQSAPPTEAKIPLPGFEADGPAMPTGVYAVIRRADVPLDESTDEAWSIINEQVVPPLTRGTWRGNGLRIGLLPREQLDRYSQVMPQPVGFSRVLINKSDYLVPIVESPRLRNDVRFEMDLTRLPRPRQIETLQGGQGSSVRLLARIETEADGRHSLVLIPQHHIPSPLDLIPRDTLAKEMDGRVFEELALRVTLGKDQIAVVGLHWPWPMGEAIEDDEPRQRSPASGTPTDLLSQTRTMPLLAADPKDPAAPPAHLQIPDDRRETERPEPALNQADQQPAQTSPRITRIAPPLATSFGSTLLTGTRIRQPVKTVLLITIEEPPQTPPDPQQTP